MPGREGWRVGEAGAGPSFILFGHRRYLVAFNGTGLQNKSFKDRAEISKA